MPVWPVERHIAHDERAGEHRLRVLLQRVPEGRAGRNNDLAALNEANVAALLAFDHGQIDVCFEQMKIPRMLTYMHTSREVKDDGMGHQLTQTLPERIYTIHVTCNTYISCTWVADGREYVSIHPPRCMHNEASLRVIQILKHIIRIRHESNIDPKML